MNRAALATAFALLIICACRAEPAYRVDKSISHGDNEDSIFFIDDDNYIFDGGCRLYNLQKKKFSKDCDLPTDPRWATPSPSGKKIFVTSIGPASETFESYIYDTASRGIVFRLHKAIFAAPIAVHPNEKMLAMMKGKDPDVPDSGQVVLTDLEGNALSSPVDTGAVINLLFSDDGSGLSIIREDGTATFCTVASHRLGPCQDDALPSPFISPNSQYVVNSDGKAVSLRDRTGLELFKLPMDTTKETGRYVSYSRDGRRLAIKGLLPQENGKIAPGFVAITFEKPVFGLSSSTTAYKAD
ncbi:hypothetical protein [Vulcaniibacterium tengchongense]|uniref:WD40 repeat protein n=1 Tax=Vulcaniibacterium tengchongense TaxID=1273429 RepID=A0A3N4VS50_9GAMM|nr:hypothetical protein [Vulcaniibacterium tengchongense]RPE75884.1 hypothetical protein EDC50_2784 [Vulcaniibacterium tengchongense]